jgi:hypothetical protein
MQHFIGWMLIVVAVLVFVAGIIGTAGSSRCWRVQCDAGYDDEHRVDNHHYRRDWRYRDHVPSGVMDSPVNTPIASQCLCPSGFASVLNTVARVLGMR